MSELLPLLITKEWPWAICYRHSLKKSDESNLLFFESELLFCSPKMSDLLENQRVNSQLWFLHKLSDYCWDSVQQMLNKLDEKGGKMYCSMCWPEAVVVCRRAPSPWPSQPPATHTSTGSNSSATAIVAAVWLNTFRQPWLCRDLKLCHLLSLWGVTGNPIKSVSQVMKVISDLTIRMSMIKIKMFGKENFINLNLKQS